MKRLVIILAGVFFMFPTDAQVRYLPEDTLIFTRFLGYSQQGGQDIVRTARFFMDTPYVGGTLEGDNKEQLRINLRELDCVTFVENVAALHLLLQSDHRTFANFCRILQLIRYRGGIIDGYLSRLHYTSEWLANNCQKQIASQPAIPDCQSFAPEVSFMSTHCDAYPALKAHPDWCKTMSAIETNINELRLCYIPKERVKDSEANIRNGDIIAITTHMKGLDIAHTGFALVQNGRMYLLHASSEARKVMISDETLHDYLARRKSHSGIIVVRIK
ncbi:MAG: DUF1460 domain-containing protein [Bacteroidales bacterium]|jgi:hypothetical protein|nr:DUF1460 domain-containing protein [Bacteroidales bacterium]